MAARGAAGHHRPQCRRISSITLPCGGSIKATTFIWPDNEDTERVDLDPLDEHRPRLAGRLGEAATTGAHRRQFVYSA